MKTLGIRLLGELDLGEGTQRLPPSRRTRALLAYLAVERRAHSRQRLCDLFWGGPNDPRAALRWSLSKLRAVLPLETSGEHVQLGAEVASDVAFVQEALARGAASLATAELVDVARLFRGEPLEGLDIRDCFQFQEWLLATREHLRACEISVLQELVKRLRESDPAAALAYARKRVAIDPLLEAGHVTVLELLGAAGRMKEAVAHFERCKRMLTSELGAQRWPALERARAALRPSGGPERASAPLLEQTPRAQVTATCIGRAAELAALSHVFVHGGVALVLGEPGIGKSRLLEATSEQARASGAIVLRGRAFEAEMIRPYGAVIDALRSIPLRGLVSEGAASLGPLLPELAKSTSEQRLDRERLFDGVLDFVRALARSGARVALLLDDVQWLDDASAALVHFLARAGEPALTLALGARDGELEDNAPVLRVVRSLRKGKSLHEIRLGPLSLEETTLLVADFGGSVDARLVHDAADGNPLFTLELAAAVASGLAPDELPHTLLGLLSERLERLDEHGRALVPWAATLGHSFALATLGAVSGTAPEELLRGIEELERRGVLKVAPAGSSQFGYDFVHDLVRRAAYQALSVPRRRLCHARAAEILWRDVERDASLASDVAHHAALAGEHAVAARACAEAGAHCLRVFAYAEALELARQGRRHAAELPAAERRALEIPLLSLLVHADTPARHDELDATLFATLSEAQADGDRRGVATAAKALALLRYFRGDLPGAGEVSVRVADAVRSADDPHEVANELAQSARCLTLVGRVEESRELLGEALEVGRKNGVAPIELAFAQATLAHFDGELERAEELFRATLAAARRFEDHWRGSEALARLVMIALERDDLDAAAGLALELAVLAERIDRDGAELFFAKALSALVEVRTSVRGGSRPETAPLLHAIERLRAIDTKAFLVFSLNALAEVELGARLPDAAETHATEAAALARRIKNRSELAVATSLVARSWRLRGDEPRARAVIAEATAELTSDEEISSRARRHLAQAKKLTA